MGRSTTTEGPGSQTVIGAASLAVGPLVMAVGDLLHPKDTPDIGGKAAIIVAQPTRFYLAHLLSLVGLVLFVPGLLALTDLAAARRPRFGYAARVLMVIGVAGWVATFAAEMLVGRLSLGAAAIEDVLRTALSGPVAGPMVPVTLAFFVAVALLAAPLIVASGPLRWPAVVFVVGMGLVLAEVISSQKLLSQVGVLLVWGASAAFAWLLVRGQVRAPAGAAAGQALPAD
jgi:hypothetical protein